MLIYFFLFKINVDSLNDDPGFKTLKSQMGITYQDEIVISPQQMPNYTDRVRQLTKKNIISSIVVQVSDSKEASKQIFLLFKSR